MNLSRVGRRLDFGSSTGGASCNNAHQLGTRDTSPGCGLETASRSYASNPGTIDTWNPSSTTATPSIETKWGRPLPQDGLSFS